MARRSVIRDVWGRTLEVSPRGVEDALLHRYVEHDAALYDGDLADANVYRLSDHLAEEFERVAIYRVAVLLGANALGPVTEPPYADENGHVPTGNSPYCSRCGLHLTMWEEHACNGKPLTQVAPLKLVSDR